MGRLQPRLRDALILRRACCRDDQQERNDYSRLLCLVTGIAFCSVSKKQCTGVVVKSLDASKTSLRVSAQLFKFVRTAHIPGPLQSRVFGLREEAQRFFAFEVFHQLRCKILYRTDYRGRITGLSDELVDFCEITAVWVRKEGFKLLILFRSARSPLRAEILHPRFENSRVRFLAFSNHSK